MDKDNSVEIKGVEMHDILGLSQPLTKLVETVSSGVGTLYEPIHAKRMAKAKNFEMQLISNTINNNLQLPIRYQDGNITIDSANANELVQRAQIRFLFQEMKKQQNIDSVISIAHSILEEIPSVSDAPVDSDWISTFFDSVTNVSKEDMQILWGKILAGEVERPGSFSLRTLNVLKNLTQKEASIFHEISPYVLKCPGNKEGTVEDYFLMGLLDENKSYILEQYGIPFTSIMLLSEAGLISESTTISIGFEVKAHDIGFIKGTSSSIQIKNMSAKGLPLDVHHNAFFLTEAGKELLPISLANEYQNLSNKYIAECSKELQKYGLSFPEGAIDPCELSIEIIKL